MGAATLIGLISAVLSFARLLISLAQTKGWIDQGAADAALKTLQDSDNAISRAATARNAARVNNERDPAGVLRDDDGFKRPGD
jgi:hypothetical protein